MKKIKPHRAALKSPINSKIASAIKLIDKVFEKQNLGIILAYNPAEYDKDNEVCITAIVCTKDNSELPAGTVEYNVSDGLPGKRGMSWDYYDLDEALAMFKAISEHGWKLVKLDNKVGAAFCLNG